MGLPGRLQPIYRRGSRKLKASRRSSNTSWVPPLGPTRVRAQPGQCIWRGRSSSNGESRVPDWRVSVRYKYDVVIIGVGSAGMIAGEVAAKMGVKAAIVERHR